MGGLPVSLNFDVTILSPNFAQTVVMAPGAATLLTVAGVAFVGVNVPAASLATALAPFLPAGPAGPAGSLSAAQFDGTAVTSQEIGRLPVFNSDGTLRGYIKVFGIV